MNETENNNEGAAAAPFVQVPQLQEETRDYYEEESDLNFDESPSHLNSDDHNEGENQNTSPEEGINI